MAGIEDFVKMAAQNLGQSEDSTRSATGALLGAIKQNADGGDFQQLLDKIPGASGLLGASEEPSSGGGGGLLGGALGAAKSAFGGSAGGALGILGAIQGSGFDASSAGGLVSTFLQFAKSNAGEGLVGKLLAKMPELAKLAG